MEREQLERTEMLLGGEAVQRLRSARVAVFGIGGVGGYAAEALARSGVGTLDLIDKDVVSVSNINRQIIALHSTVGRPKTQVMRERIGDISPDTVVNTYECFFLPENADSFDFTQYDYVLDAVDTVSAKLELAVRCAKARVPVISCMGAGNKLDPTRFEVADVYKTSVCPLAKVMRRELKARGIKRLKVVYSKEEVKKPLKTVTEEHRRAIPGSIAFVPSVAGLIMAGEAIKDIVDYCSLRSEHLLRRP